ncbi:MAG: 16S rRNA (cytosine(1402)-N(4))-methyltransferase, partial [Phycisphaerae bacterium]
MNSAEHGHEPVLLGPVLEYLNPQPGAVFVDCTAGRGGHSLALAQRLGPTGTLVALDVDPDNLAYARQRLAALPNPPTCRWFHANFAEVDDVLAK